MYRVAKWIVILGSLILWIVPPLALIQIASAPTLSLLERGWVALSALLLFALGRNIVDTALDLLKRAWPRREP